MVVWWCPQLLVELIAAGMVSSTAQLSPPLFEAVREVRARTYHNVLIKPHKLAKLVPHNSDEIFIYLLTFIAHMTTNILPDF